MGTGAQAGWGGLSNSNLPAHLEIPLRHLEIGMSSPRGPRAESLSHIREC